MMQTLNTRLRTNKPDFPYRPIPLDDYGNPSFIAWLDATEQTAQPKLFNILLNNNSLQSKILLTP